jgi:HK97 family phage prohead protease
VTDLAVAPAMPSLPSIERRGAEFTKTEFREQSDKMIFEGRAAVFGIRTRIGGAAGFEEQIKRGAFRKADFSDTVFALNHNYDLTMARTSVADGPGMLALEEGTRGLEVYAELAPTQTARDTKTLVETGVIRQMSFAWPAGATTDEWSDDYNERSITEFRKILDTSPVVFPAYKDTEASVRSLVDALSESFRPELPVEERIAAFQAILGRINPESPLASEITGRALSQASAELHGGAGLAEAAQEAVAAMGERLGVRSFDTRLFERQLQNRKART